MTTTLLVGEVGAVRRTIGDLLDDLGQISPRRIRMQPPPGTATEADLIATNEARQGICELVDGVLVEKGMGYIESELALALAFYLRAWVVPRNLGRLSGEAGMMRLQPNLLRAPDIAFTSWERIPGRRSFDPIAGFAPDLAVETLSASNTQAEMQRKRREYFGAGVRLVWEVDPVARTVALYDAPEHATVLGMAQVLDGGAVLPGFLLPLAELFGELDRQPD